MHDTRFDPEAIEEGRRRREDSLNGEFVDGVLLGLTREGFDAVLEEGAS